MAREEFFSVNLARRLEKLPTPGVSELLKYVTFETLQFEQLSLHSFTAYKQNFTKNLQRNIIAQFVELMEKN